MFGHVVPTGAGEDRKIFEQANKGTIFLMIGEAPLETQVKLLEY